MKTLIAIPCMDTVPVQFAESLINLTKPEDTKIMFQANSLIYNSRNIIAITAIKNEFDYVLWLDSDMMFAPPTLELLMKDAEENHYGMVSGLYFKRRIPVEPVIYSQLDPPEDVDGTLQKRIYEYLDYPDNSLFEIQGCGFGCVLTSVPLLKRMVDTFGLPFMPNMWGGEDISFCYRVKQAGEKMYCDSRVKCGHIGQMIFSESVYKNNRGNTHE